MGTGWFFPQPGRGRVELHAGREDVFSEQRCGCGGGGVAQDWSPLWLCLLGRSWPLSNFCLGSHKAWVVPEHRLGVGHSQTGQQSHTAVPQVFRTSMSALHRSATSSTGDLWLNLSLPVYTARTAVVAEVTLVHTTSLSLHT